MQELSNRERELLQLASDGMTDETIATKLGISVATVRGYWLRIKGKLGGNGRAQLVGQWIRLNSDAAGAQVAKDHDDAARSRQSEFEDALAKERSDMDKVLGLLTEEQLDEIAKIRDRTNLGIALVDDEADDCTE